MHKKRLLISAVLIDDDKETIQLSSELRTSNGIQIVGKGHDSLSVFNDGYFFFD